MPLTARDFLPPVINKLRRALSRPRQQADALFDGDDRLFINALAGCDLYGEYGMGTSTRWVLANTKADVICVDTSKDWVESVTSSNPASTRLKAHWVDLGPVGSWGRPLSYARRDNFQHYALRIWEGGRKPSVVLIDGRFRVCCFFQSLLEAEPGTSIIFDDYPSRPHYHIVEELLRPSDRCGRQMLFVVPPELEREKITHLRDRFLYVMD